MNEAEQGGQSSAQQLASQMEREYGCERCHERPATEMFDRLFVCSPCRREMEEELVKHG